MNRRKFIGLAGGGVIATSTAGYLISDKSNLSRADLARSEPKEKKLKAVEREILLLASLAPSGHNTQPWFVQYLEPFHWIIGNDRVKWLPAVDPTQRETILSLGAFVQNLEYAAGAFGFGCQWNPLAKTNQDEQLMEVKLVRLESRTAYDVTKIRLRRTVRAGFATDVLKKADLDALVGGDADAFSYLARGSKENQYLEEQTIEANRIQAYRDPAQRELADWVRFSNKEARLHRDGLTTAGMEIEGIPGWIVRNFYRPADVMKSNFRQQGLDKVRKSVAASAGWILITSKDDSVATLLETGRRMQRLFLTVRERGIALHPMTQILEEPATRDELNRSIGITDHIQFILRAGYFNNYQPPVSLRRPVDWFVRP